MRTRGIQLIVWHRMAQKPKYYKVSKAEDGWRIDTDIRHLVIGRGMGRIMIPLDNVESYEVDEFWSEK